MRKPWAWPGIYNVIPQYQPLSWKMNRLDHTLAQHMRAKKKKIEDDVFSAMIQDRVLFYPCHL